jgi:mono/diheme cytochrome c family protein
MRLSLTLAAVFLAGAAQAAPVDYLGDIKPVLMKNCAGCHGSAKAQSGLRLDTFAGLIQGGNSGKVVIPGRSAESKMVKAITGSDPKVVRMPQKGHISADEVALLRRWIDEGAAGPKREEAAAGAKSTHWSFQPVRRPTEPAVKKGTWARNPIDRFILAELEKRGVGPSPEAAPETLIRRVTLDLTGLPPTLEEVDRFLKEWAAKPQAAYEALVDRLLASPHYGEMQARHWLDLARYADSNGFNIDAPRQIWKYRDWVIDAFNRDLPFDRFTVEQLAGDLLPQATTEQKVATGFHRNTLINQEGGIDVEQFRVESVVDRVNTTGAVWLGLTVGCCQCHDHKFDPLTQREYYQFFAFFNNCDEPDLEILTPAQQEARRQVRAQLTGVEAELARLDPTNAANIEIWERAVARTHAAVAKDVAAVFGVAENGRTAKQKRVLEDGYRTADQTRHACGALVSPFAAVAHAGLLKKRSELVRQRDDLRKKEPAAIKTMVMRERTAPRATHVLLGGDFLRKGVTVGPGTPAVLPPLPADPAKRTRLDLARWLVSPENPLTPRVAVNRFWAEFFGSGLVETENDFGTQGTPPSHPELLDWLASEFVRQKWSVKALHKTIVMSATYRQSSKSRPDLAALDARNRLLARQSRLRAPAEVVRDVSLAASGLLAPKVGGPSVFPPQPDGVYRFTQIDKGWRLSPGADRYRRGMYTHFWRSAPHPALIVFDAPDSTTACTRRNRSNTPLQALTLLNDAGFYEYAAALSKRVLAEGPVDDEGRLRFAFRLCLARAPGERESVRLRAFLAERREELAAAPEEARGLAGGAADESDSVCAERAAWVLTARVLLNLDEFITRE